MSSSPWDWSAFDTSFAHSMFCSCFLGESDAAAVCLTSSLFPLCISTTGCVCLVLVELCMFESLVWCGSPFRPPFVHILSSPASLAWKWIAAMTNCSALFQWARAISYFPRPGWCCILISSLFYYYLHCSGISYNPYAAVRDSPQRLKCSTLSPRRSGIVLMMYWWCPLNEWCDTRIDSIWRTHASALPPLD